MGRLLAKDPLVHRSPSPCLGLARWLVIASALAWGCTASTQTPSAALVTPEPDPTTIPADAKPPDSTPETEPTELVTFDDADVEMGSVERVTVTPQRPRLPSMLPGVITGPSRPR